MREAPSDNVQRPARLAPALGLFSAMAMVVGEVIGSGIFLKPRQVVLATGDYVGLILVLWVACGLVNLCGALSLAELSAMFPLAGGTYVFLREAYGRLWSFLWGWAEFWIIRSGAIAALAAYSALSLKGALEAAGIASLGTRMQLVVAVGLIVLLGAVNTAGAYWGGAVQNVMTTIKVAFVLLLVAFPWLALHAERVPLGPLFPTAVDSGLLAGIGSALAAIMWAYDGWGNITVIAEEVREPQRNVPRALIGGVMLLVVLYFGANLAYHLTLTGEELTREFIPAVALGKRLLPRWGEPLILSMLMISLAGALNGNIFVGPRVLFAVARDHRFLGRLARVSAGTGTPALAILATCGWAIILLLLAEAVREEHISLFDLLTNYSIFGGSIFYCSAVAAVFVLRRRRPEAPRPYRTWGYPLVPAVVVVFYAVFLTSMFWGRPKESLIGVGLIGAGVVVFWLCGDREVSKTPEASKT